MKTVDSQRSLETSVRIVDSMVFSFAKRESGRPRRTLEEIVKIGRAHV